MASEQLIQEELQSSTAISSEPSASPQHIDDDESTGTLERAAQLGMTANGMRSDAEAGDDEHYTGEESEEDDEEDAEGEDEEFHQEDADADGDDYESEGAADDDELEEDDTTILPSTAANRRLRIKHADDDDDEDDEEDAEGEDDSEGDHEDHDHDDHDEHDDHEDDEGFEDDAVGDAEGVGAVKIRPGETEEDDDDDSEASAAASESSDEEWDEQAHNADEDDEDEDEEEEEAEEEIEEDARGPDIEAEEREYALLKAGRDPEEEDDDEYLDCLYCRQGYDEPRKYDYNFWTCPTCTNKAHAECCYENQMDEEIYGGQPWRCPDCVIKTRKEKAAAAAAANGEAMDVDADADASNQLTNGAEIANGTPPNPTIQATLKDSTPKSSPALRGAATANADSASGDHTDNGPRSLRKRRTSPVESADSGMSLRKRRKNVTEDLSIDGFTDIHNATVASSARSLRIKPPAASQVQVVKKTRSSLILKIKVPPKHLRRITIKKRKYTKRGTAPPRISKKEKKRLEQLALENGLAVGSDALPVMPSTTAYTQPFYSFFDKETDEQKGKPYGGILTEAEADTSKTFPTPDDRRRFDDAKQKAEEEWRQRLLVMQAEAEAQPAKKKKAAGPASQIECIEFGGWEIDTWYAAPYPEEYSRNRVLYICEFCLKYMNSDYVAWRHKLKCPAKHPPGDEIYRHNSISFFEVDGRKNPVYCQNLCLLAKLFLGSKTLYYDVEPFLFYVLCEYDEFGYHFVGYFSKEKRASSQNNVSCILTLPIHQRKGYGNLLIDFSYLLTRVEEKTGSPEKPLSDMGLVSYRNYWRLVMCKYLLDAMTESKGSKLGLSIKQISDDTGMTADDVISALEGLRCLVRDPQTGLYAFRVDIAYCREYVAKWESKKYVTLKPSALTWTPYVMGRGNATNFELGPALNAIAPREEDEEQKAAEQFVASLANGDSISTQGGMTNGAGAADGGVSNVDGAAEDNKALASTAMVLESTEPNDKDGMVVDGAEKTKDEADIKTNGDMTAASAGDSSQTMEGGAEPPVANIISDIKSEDEDGDEDGDEEDEVIRSSKRRGPVAMNGVAADEEQKHDLEHDKDVHDRSALAASVSGTVASAQKQENGADGNNDGGDWSSAYASVPTTRFVVFPPVSQRRLNSYPRAPIGRPPGARTGTGNRTHARRSTGHVRRAVVSAPRRPKAPSSSKKKSGGTGRGPGRWPKGTKKSDYGNAESGPGLPPAWLAKRIASGNRTGAEANGDVKGEGGEADVHEDADAHDTKPPITPSRKTASSHDEEADAEGEDDDNAVADTVQVHTPTLPSRLTDRRGGVNGAVLASGTRGRSSPRLGKIKAAADDSDTVMVDVGDA